MILSIVAAVMTMFVLGFATGGIEETNYYYSDYYTGEYYAGLYWYDGNKGNVSIFCLPLCLLGDCIHGTVHHCSRDAYVCAGVFCWGYWRSVTFFFVYSNSCKLTIISSA